MSETFQSQIDRRRDELKSGPIDRRTLLKYAAGLAALSGVTLARGRSASAAVTQLRFDGFGGVLQDAISQKALQPFTKKSGIKVVEGSFGTQAEIISKIKAGSPGEFNIIHDGGPDYYLQMTNLGLNSELNEANIPNLKLVMPAILKPFRDIAPVLSSVPFDYGTTGIAYNTKYISEAEIKELGVKVFLDKRFAGKISLLDDAQSRIWSAALQTGQDPNKIEDMDRVWEAIRQSRELCKKYWGSGAELMDLLSREEVVVADAWSTRAAALKEGGFPIGFIDPPGGLVWMEDMFVVKGSPMPESEALLNFMLEPEAIVAACETGHLVPSLDPTKVNFPDSIKNLPCFDPTGTLTRFAVPDARYWASNIDAWRKQWDRVAKGA